MASFISFQVQRMGRFIFGDEAADETLSKKVVAASVVATTAIGAFKILTNSKGFKEAAVKMSLLTAAEYLISGVASIIVHSEPSDLEDQVSEASTFILVQKTTLESFNQLKESYKAPEMLDPKKVVGFDNDRPCPKETAISTQVDKQERFAHANFVQLGDFSKYIASQYPQNISLNLQVWMERGVSILLDLTSIEDRAKNIYRPYLPEVSKTFCFFDKISAQCTSVTSLRFLNIFKYTLKHLETSQTHEMVKIHYTHWFDGLAIPPEELIRLIKKVDQEILKLIKQRNQNSQKSDAMLIAVHCGAGLGRTGTFIVSRTHHQKSNRLKKPIDKETIHQDIHAGRMQRGPEFVMSPHQLQLLYDFNDLLAEKWKTGSPKKE